MDNQNFIQEEKNRATTPAVIPPTKSQPFTVDMIREGLMDVSFGRKQYTELAQELNDKAYNHYNKK
ncbi:hypothetical protein ACLOAU_14505 [Niabella sp. CJ426]|uniref:hypothetical protein n=1 Tax=Niabella sp. CJ426 TaxID=3393740 RepID=UPI003D03609A